MNTLKAVWILNNVPNFGIQRFKEIQNKVSDFNLFDTVQFEDVCHQLHWDPNYAVQFEQIKQAGNFERAHERCTQQGIHLISILDREYPKNLLTIYDPPLILYIKGNLIPEDELAIAIVGSRNASLYGLKICGQFASQLAEKGITIVSGFARGIDGEAHRSSLRAKGRTIAVLGCGLDVIYPKEHVSLYEKISENGAVISEFSLGTPPQAFNFPMRNRIISGLSKGILVVEASRRSGSLITSSSAAEQGREVYVIPGPIDQYSSQGTNELIQKGAKLVVSVEDILEDLAPQLKASLRELGCQDSEDKSETKDTKVDDPLLQLLQKKPLSLDEIIASSNEKPHQIQIKLTHLELKGSVKRQFGGRYILVN